MSTTEVTTSKRVFFGLFLLGAGLLAVSLTRGIFDLLVVYERVEGSEKRVEELEAERVRLEREEAWRSSRVYQDAEIREHLHMALPGEAVVVMPEYLDELAYIPVERGWGKRINLENDDPVWRMWWEVFARGN